MKVSVCQFNPVFGETVDNLNTIARLLENVDTDLAVLPELCTTGYRFVNRDEASRLSEPVPGGESVRFLEEFCRRKGIILAAGIAESDAGRFYNSAVLLGPGGYIGKYRKVHLFDEEKLWFLPGEEGFSVWDTGTAKIGLMICFDWIFPESARSLALAGCEVLCHPSNLVLPYCQDAMITRSIENRIFTATANRTGTEARGDKKPLTFTGGSQVTGTKGELLLRMGETETGIGTVEIEPELAGDKRVTGRNHLWEDRRPGLYGSIVKEGPPDE